MNDTFEPNHKHLILRQHAGMIGIWHLREADWHTKPFTRSTVEGAQRLKDAREGKVGGKYAISTSWGSIALAAALVGVWLI